MANQLAVELDHPEFGPISQNGVLMKFSDTPSKIWSSAPILGQHTREVLTEIGYTADQIRELEESRIVLAREPRRRDSHRL